MSTRRVLGRGRRPLVLVVALALCLGGCVDELSERPLQEDLDSRGLDRPKGNRGTSTGVRRSSGRAPCLVADGYRTVHFDNGAMYSGSFKDCRPLSGRATYGLGSVHLAGYATAVDDHTVVLNDRDRTATITLVLHRE